MTPSFTRLSRRGKQRLWERTLKRKVHRAESPDVAQNPGIWVSPWMVVKRVMQGPICVRVMVAQRGFVAREDPVSDRPAGPLSPEMKVANSRVGGSRKGTRRCHRSR